MQNFAHKQASKSAFTSSAATTAAVHAALHHPTSLQSSYPFMNSFDASLSFTSSQGSAGSSFPLEPSCNGGGDDVKLLSQQEQDYITLCMQLSLSQPSYSCSDDGGGGGGGCQVVSMKTVQQFAHPQLLFDQITNNKIIDKDKFQKSPSAAAAAASLQNSQLDSQLNDLTVILSSLIASEETHQAAAALLYSSITAPVATSETTPNRGSGGDFTSQALRTVLNSSESTTATSTAQIATSSHSSTRKKTSSINTTPPPPAAAVNNHTGCYSNSSSTLIQSKPSKSAFRKISAGKKLNETTATATESVGGMNPPAIESYQEGVDLFAMFTSLLSEQQQQMSTQSPLAVEQSDSSEVEEDQCTPMRGGVKKKKKAISKCREAKQSERVNSCQQGVLLPPLPQCLPATTIEEEGSTVLIGLNSPVAAKTPNRILTPVAVQPSLLGTPRNNDRNNSNGVGFKLRAGRVATATAVSPLSSNPSRFSPIFRCGSSQKIGQSISAFQLVKSTNSPAIEEGQKKNFTSHSVILESSSSSLPAATAICTTAEAMEVEETKEGEVGLMKIGEVSPLSVMQNSHRQVDVSNIQEANNLIASVIGSVLYYRESPVRRESSASSFIEEEEKNLIMTKKQSIDDGGRCSPTSDTSEAAITASSSDSQLQQSPFLSKKPRQVSAKRESQRKRQLLSRGLRTPPPPYQASPFVTAPKKRLTEVQKLLQSSSVVAAAEVVTDPVVPSPEPLPPAKKARGLRMLNSQENAESVIKPAEANEELFTNMDGFTEATQNIMAAFEKVHLKRLSFSANQAADFRNFMRSARKNDEHVGLLLNPRVCIYSPAFLEYLRGPALEWIRNHIEQRKQPIYVQLIQIFRSEDRSIAALRPRKDRSLLSNLSLRKQ